jgi:hypothetical protein
MRMLVIRFLKSGSNHQRKGNKEVYHEEKNNFYSIDVILSFDWHFSVAGEIKRVLGRNLKIVHLFHPKENFSF